LYNALFGGAVNSIYHEELHSCCLHLHCFS
jgi:hypothetical protein